MRGYRIWETWKFGSTITKIVRSISHPGWFQCMIVRVSSPRSVPHTSVWRPARAETAPPMAKTTSKLAVPASAPKFLKAHHETALRSTSLCTVLLQANTLSPTLTTKRTFAAMPPHITPQAGILARGSTITQIIRSLTSLLLVGPMNANEHTPRLPPRREQADVEQHLY